MRSCGRPLAAPRGPIWLLADHGADWLMEQRRHPLQDVLGLRTVPLLGAQRVVFSEDVDFRGGAWGLQAQLDRQSQGSSERSKLVSQRSPHRRLRGAVLVVPGLDDALEVILTDLGPDTPAESVAVSFSTNGDDDDAA